MILKRKLESIIGQRKTLLGVGPMSLNVIDSSIELANQLIGVTMQEAGVSKLVSVSIERALALAEKTQRNKNNSEGV